MAAWPRGRLPRAKVIGTVVAVLALVACVRFALRHAQTLPPVVWDRDAILGFAAASALHLLALTLIAVGWQPWLRALGHRLPLAVVVPAFLGAQLAKYLPGNVMQYAARVELIHRRGVPRRDTTRSIVLEAATLVLTGLIVALVVARGPGAVLLERLYEHMSPHRAARFFALIVVAGCGGLFLARGRWGRHGAVAVRPRALGVALISTLPLYLAFFVAEASSLHWVATGIFGVENLSFVVIVGLLALAWTAGFVTPGAPAGLGVRDLILLAGIDVLAGPGLALGIAGLHRLATTVGDAGGLVVAGLLRGRVSR